MPCRESVLERMNAGATWSCVSLHGSRRRHARLRSASTRAAASSSDAPPPASRVAYGPCHSVNAVSALLTITSASVPMFPPPRWRARSCCSDESTTSADASANDAAVAELVARDVEVRQLHELPDRVRQAPGALCVNARVAQAQVLQGCACARAAR